MDLRARLLTGILFRYVECTSAAIQALVAFKKLYPGHRREDVQLCINKAAAFLETIQESDGSWFVFHLILTWSYMYSF